MKPAVYLEAVLVGLLVLLVGLATSTAFMLLPRPTDLNKWNKFHYMEISLFLTGVIVHLGCEATGLNKLYCKKGAACL